jgi:hypothetical protein
MENLIHNIDRCITNYNGKAKGIFLVACLFLIVYSFLDLNFKDNISDVIGEKSTNVRNLKSSILPSNSSDESIYA